MKKRILISTFAVIIFFAGIFYFFDKISSAYEFRVSTYSSSIGSKPGNMSRHTSDDDNLINFTLKQFDTPESQKEFKDKLLAIEGIKSVDFGKVCPEAKVMKVTILFNTDKTNKSNVISEISKLGIDAGEFKSYHHGKTNGNKNECPYMKKTEREIKT